MPDDDAAACSKAFEQWAKGRSIYTARREGRMVDRYAEDCWDIWQTAWKAAGRCVVAA